MKKLLILLGFLTFYCSIFGQYTGNKLPSGLTVSIIVDSADYTIIQKNGETIVKAVRMDTLKSFFSTGIIESIESLDSVSGSTGQFIISDGSGWLAPVSAKYEGTDAYTFGYRSGAVGAKSFIIGGSSLQPAIASGNTSVAIGRLAEATASTSIAMGLYARATGAESIAVGSNSLSSGYAAFSAPYSTASGDYSAAFISGTASGAYSFAVGADSEASGTDAVSINGSTVTGNNSVGINYSIVTADYGTGINGGNVAADSSVAIMGGVSKYKKSIAIGGNATTDAENSFAIGTKVISSDFREIVLGSENDTLSGSKTTWVATDRLLTIGNGTEDSRSNALVMLKNGNTTATGSWTFDGNITADTIVGYCKTESSFGELWVADGATPQSIANGTTYVKMTGFVRRGNYENMTVDSTNDKITITETGYYLVNITMSSICGTNGVVSRTTAFLGGVEQDNIHYIQTISNTASPNPGSCSGIIKVTTVPVDLDVRRRHDNGSPVNFTLVYGNLTCHKIAEL